MDQVALLSIGEFARAARLSVKALRHYDAMGVLVPAHVDPYSGYRRYDPAQLQDALLITLLRQADIGLPVVKSALENRSQLAELVDAELERLRAQAQRAQTALALASQLAAGGGASGYEPLQISVESEQVARRRGTATAESVDTEVPAVIDQLIAESGIADAPVTGRFPVQLDGEFGFDVNVPSASGAFELPGGDFVGVIHRGPFALLPLAYHALFEELSKLGAPVPGQVRERYLSDPACVAAEDFETEVLLPLP